MSVIHALLTGAVASALVCHYLWANRLKYSFRWKIGQYDLGNGIVATLDEIDPTLDWPLVGMIKEDGKLWHATWRLDGRYDDKRFTPYDLPAVVVGEL